MPPTYEVVYKDADLIAVNKPSGLLTHPSAMASEEATSLVLLLRQDFGAGVAPCHRLDRATSGLVLFATNKQALSAVNKALAAHEVTKRYLGLARGWITECCTIDYPLQLEEPRRRGGSRPTQDAVTAVTPCQWYEHPSSSGRYPSTRLTLCEITPLTGRRHQIRRHLAHIRHPLVGDTSHGDGKLNQWARQVFASQRLFLHAQSISLKHPLSGDDLTISAPPGSSWEAAMQLLRLNEVRR